VPVGCLGMGTRIKFSDPGPSGGCNSGAAGPGQRGTNNHTQESNAGHGGAFLIGVLRDVSLTLPMRIVPRSDSHEIVSDLLGKVRSVYEHFGSQEVSGGQASA